MKLSNWATLEFDKLRGDPEIQHASAASGNLERVYCIGPKQCRDLWVFVHDRNTTEAYEPLFEQELSPPGPSINELKGIAQAWEDEYGVAYDAGISNSEGE